MTGHGTLPGGAMMPAPTPLAAEDVLALVHGRHRDPFRVLGPHASGTGLVIRVMRPGAARVVVIVAPAGSTVEMARVHEIGRASCRERVYLAV